MSIMQLYLATFAPGVWNAPMRRHRRALPKHGVQPVAPGLRPYVCPDHFHGCRPRSMARQFMTHLLSLPAIVTIGRL